MPTFRRPTGRLDVERYGDGWLYRLRVDGEEHMIDREMAERLFRAEAESPLSAEEIRTIAGLPPR